MLVKEYQGFWWWRNINVDWWLEFGSWCWWGGDLTWNFDGVLEQYQWWRSKTGFYCWWWCKSLSTGHRDLNLHFNGGGRSIGIVVNRVDFDGLFVKNLKWSSMKKTWWWQYYKERVWQDSSILSAELPTWPMGSLYDGFVIWFQGKTVRLNLGWN